eukprot:366546-Chlamydomonas_euryale.AAC.32
MEGFPPHAIRASLSLLALGPVAERRLLAGTAAPSAVRHARLTHRHARTSHTRAAKKPDGACSCMGARRARLCVLLSSPRLPHADATTRCAMCAPRNAPRELRMTHGRLAWRRAEERPTRPKRLTSPSSSLLLAAMRELKALGRGLNVPGGRLLARTAPRGRRRRNRPRSADFNIRHSPSPSPVASCAGRPLALALVLSLLAALAPTKRASPSSAGRSREGWEAACVEWMGAWPALEAGPTRPPSPMGPHVAGAHVCVAGRVRHPAVAAPTA